MTESALFKSALSRAMDLCSRREYCTRDISTKLSSWGVGDSDISRIIAALIAENFINETRYAEAFVKDKFNYNKWGRIKIAANLRIKKIPSEIIKNALNIIDNELYRKLLQELIKSHRKSVKAKNQYDLKGKLLRYGLSKGFESDLLYEILSDSE